MIVKLDESFKNYEADRRSDFRGIDAMFATSKMRNRACATMMAALLLAISGWARGAETKSIQPVPLAVASVHFEQNATDGDVEVVFEVKGGEDGLVELIVVSPDGRTVVDLKSPDSSTLGLRQFRFESPEPPDVEALKAAYPAGVYEFSGKTSSGDELVGRSTLSHRLPATATLIRPSTAAADVPVKDFKISWRAIDDVALYILEIEHDELNVNITAALPGSSTSFDMPDGFLLPGNEYEIAIGTVSGEGNISFVESTFRTKN